MRTPTLSGNLWRQETVSCPSLWPQHAAQGQAHSQPESMFVKWGESRQLNSRSRCSPLGHQLYLLKEKPGFQEIMLSCPSRAGYEEDMIYSNKIYPRPYCRAGWSGNGKDPAQVPQSFQNLGSTGKPAPSIPGCLSYHPECTGPQC